MVVSLKHTGTTDCCSDALKMSENTGASWSMQVLKMQGGTLSGPTSDS